MSRRSRVVWVAGVDGCPGGWLAAFMHPRGNEARVRFVRTFREILRGPERPSVIAVDMPIGLPKVTPTRGRKADREARRPPTMRRSSVFRIPSRAAIQAGVDKTAISDDRARFRRARDIARNTSVDGKAFAKQGFYLFPKIVEIDRLLRRDNALSQRVFETHPEVAFWRMNKRQKLEHAKKQPAGAELRRRLLGEAGVQRSVVEGIKPPGNANPDDLIDALVCVVVARRIVAGKALSLPKRPPRDAFGLPMAIWA
jgi:predicted RNase H-like nuclease